ncbi:MAG: aldo/keto reductase [Alphaproteobacteria bacterium]
MDYVTLGRTGLTVSVAGLGCGGHSRLGLSQGKDDAHAADLVRSALDLGVTFIDTAAVYGTEPAVGAAIKGRRESVVISTKAPVFAGERWNLEPEVCTEDTLRASVEDSLRRLGTDVIDIMNFHGVVPGQYDPCIERLLPVFEALKAEGKIRFSGMTELFQADTDHAMLRRTVADDHFDVIMVGHNFLNPSARRGVLDIAQDKAVGTQIMFAVRQALRSVEALQPVLDSLAEEGAIAPEDADAARIEGLLLEGGATSLTDAAYRFCRHEPGAHVILTGTGNADHLAANVTSILAPPLAPAAMAELERLFGAISSVTAGETIKA